MLWNTHFALVFFWLEELWIRRRIQTFALGLVYSTRRLVQTDRPMGTATASARTHNSYQSKRLESLSPCVCVSMFGCGGFGEVVQVVSRDAHYIFICL